MIHARTCPAYNNYHPPYADCTCGGEAQSYADGYDRYPIIAARHLPEDVTDALDGTNDTGRVVNPLYYPAFAAWLDAHGLARQPYIVWFSW
jgi:hypothetical protein